MFDEELVEGGGVDAGVDCEHLGRCRGWGDPEARPAPILEVSDSGAHRGGLAGTGRTDDQDEAPLPRHRTGRVLLDGGQLVVAVEVVDVAAALGRPPLGQLEDVLLLVEDRASREDPVERSLGDRPSVDADGSVVGHGLRDVDAERLVDVRREALGALDGFGSGRTESRRECGGDLAGDLSGSPHRLGVSQRGQGGDDRVAVGDGIAFDRLGPTGDAIEVALGRVAEGVELVVPVLVELGRVCGGLGGSAVGRGLSLDAPTLPWGGATAEVVDEPLGLLVDAAGHLLRAPGEGVEDLFGCVSHLGLAVLDVVPAHAEAAGQLRSEPGGVEGRDGALVVLEGAGVERQPPTVGGHHPVDDDEVGVDLGVMRPAGVLTEGSGDQAVGVDGPDLPVDSVPAVGVVLDPTERGGDGCVVRVEDLVADAFVADGVQDGHRLRRRAGDVEASDRALVVTGAEQRAVDRVPPVHEREEVVVVGLAREPQRLGPTAEPLAGWLVAVEVVPAGTVDVVGAGVGALERGHPGGHGRLQHELVHSSVDRCDAGDAVVGFTASLLQRERSAWVTEMPVPSRWST